MRDIDVLTLPDATVVVARGEVDAYLAPDLSDALDRAVHTHTGVVVDLEAVAFLDSTALGVVVRAVRDLEAAGRAVRVVLPRGAARRIFEITTVERILPVSGSRAAALDELAGD